MSSVFYPAYSLISGITLGNTTTVTFGASHDFTIGEVVSFRVSRQYGTVELNNQEITVAGVSDSTITVPINSTNYTPFISDPVKPQALAMVVPSASGIIPNGVPPQTSLIDAFDNIPVN